ncbi:hypothetical protein D3C80_2216250 [compost metagenome]
MEVGVLAESVSFGTAKELSTFVTIEFEEDECGMGEPKDFDVKITLLIGRWASLLAVRVIIM